MTATTPMKEALEQPYLDLMKTVLEQGTDRHDRTGVPLYLLYPGTAGAAPQVLPQLLTPQRVIAAIDAL